MSGVPQTRHALRALMPPWLDRGNGRSFTTEGLFHVYDLDAQLSYEALAARWPSYCPEDALSYLARDRLLITGPADTPEVLRARLLLWLDETPLAGLPLGLLMAVQAYVAGYPQVRIVTRAGRWYTLGEGAVGRLLQLPGYEPLAPAPYESGDSWPRNAVASQVERLRFSGLYARHVAPSPNWDWDSISNPENATRWWHFWLIIYPPSYVPQVYAPGEMYGPGARNEGYGLDELTGNAVPYGTGVAFRQIIQQRKSAKSRCVSAIFAPSLSDFPVTAALGDPGMPDGTWGWVRNASAGHAGFTRRPDCRYLDSFGEPGSIL